MEGLFVKFISVSIISKLNNNFSQILLIFVYPNLLKQYNPTLISTPNMKQLLRNYSDYKKKLNDGQSEFKPQDYPFFCLTMGYLLNKVSDFDLLYQTLKQAFQLVLTDKFPEVEYFQWLLFLNQHPHRLSDCISFLDNIKNDESIDVFEEIQTLFSSNHYQKRPLKMQARCNSIDTVIMQSQSPSREEPYQDNQKPVFQHDSDMQIMKKMQEDEQMARKMQEEEEILLQQYNGKMKVEETMCEICFVDLYDGNPSFLDNCGHGFHQQCLVESFKSQISINNFPLNCPNEECKAQCLERDVKAILSEELYKKYQDHTLKAYADMHGDSVSSCPTADCGYMFFYEKGDPVRFQCLQCKKQYCLNCRCDWHNGMSCAQYKISTTVSEDDKMFLDFVKGKKFKQCPKCKYWVEKNEGCDHMTCKCKFQFCYKCGGVYMKCECVEKAQEQHQRRLEMRQQNRKRKLQRDQQRLIKKERIQREKEEKGQKPRRGRSKKQSKK